MEPPIRCMQFRHIIIPTTALCAINQLPKPSLLESTARWLAVAVIQLALSRQTTMIDRALAEDIAAAFEVKVAEIPCDIMDFPHFLTEYVVRHFKEESLEDLMFRLRVASERLGEMIANMGLYG